jgi:hypothetical protein
MGVKRGEKLTRLWLLVLAGLACLTSPSIGAKAGPDQKPNAATAHPSTPAASKSLEPSDRLVRVFASSDGKIIYVIGQLEPGTFRKFRRVLGANARAETVFLGSPGGSVVDGYFIGSMVRHRKLKTYVDSECSSSCTQIFLAGVERTASEGARLGFHEAWSVDEQGKARGSNSDLKNESFWMRASYSNAGIDKAFADRALKTPFTTLWYPSHDEMVRAKVLTKSAAPGPITVPEGVLKSVTDIDLMLQQNRFWQAYRARFPFEYRAAVDTVWRAGQTGLHPDWFLTRALEEVDAQMIHLVGRAPDPVVDALFSIWYARLVEAKAVSMKACASMDPDPDALRETVDAAYDAAKMDVYARALSAKKLMDEIPKAKADKMLRPLFSLIVEKRPALVVDTEDSSAEHSCNLYLTMFDIIRSQPTKKRITLFRGMLALDITHDEK